eukprot:CAMPEP_0119325036 /NCGR_PEP_ID=MMETSP1333-20130426/64839_1 /TAXON_ID=418940 /ORGANISM="Scyphosphaera apsteinii, Strain RCC1455" /LENGTH=289 /DNA_ID=CAMNT_0007332903 /DNA_START=83 /DNA_END=952 /DNA_ORIENTATION=+
MTGPAVDQCAAPYISVLNPSHIALRVKRDHTTSHHITLCSGDDLSEMKKRGWMEATLLDDSQSLQNQPFVTLGVGMAQKDGAACYFVVLLWPAALELRSRWGLPHADLHITLAFDPCDVHGVEKSARRRVERWSWLTPPLDWTVAANVLREALHMTSKEEFPRRVDDLLAAANCLMDFASRDGPSTDAHATLLCSRAELYYKLKPPRYEMAREDARAAAALSPANARARLLCSFSAYQLRLWEEAVRWGLEAQTIEDGVNLSKAENTKLSLMLQNVQGKLREQTNKDRK